MLAKEKRYGAINWLGIMILVVGLCSSYISYSWFEQMSSYMSIIVFVFLALLLFNNVNILEAIKKKELDIMVLIAGVVLATINLVLSHSGMGAILNITNLLLIFYLVDKVHFEYSMYYAVGITCIGIMVVRVLVINSPYNTNHAAMILFMTGCFGLTALLHWAERCGRVKVGKYITFLVMTLIIFPMVLTLRARCVLVGIVFFVLLNYLVSEEVWKCNRLYRWCTVLLIAGSVVFPVFYVWLRKMHGDISFVFMGKNFFSGRDTAWYQFLEAFGREPLTGIGSDFMTKIPDAAYTEVHNGLLSVMVVYGIPVFLLVAWNLYKSFVCAEKYAEKSIVARQGVSAIVAMAIVSVFENYMVLPYCNCLFFLLFCMSRCEENEYEKNK